MSGKGREASLEPGIKRQIFTTSPPAGRRYNPAVYASWSGDGSGPNFGPKRADTRRNKPRQEWTAAPHKRLTYIMF